MQYFHITDDQGQFIMNAPLETLEEVFGLTVSRTALLLQHTSRQDSEYEFYTTWPRWPVVRVRRLPLEIPSVPLTRRQAE